MDIHKPKPIHNFSEFLKEVGTIVLGVSIALGAEQAVEYFHWRGQVAQAREVVATEMATNVRNALYRMRTSVCVERRLDELGAILDTASKTGSLPPLGDIAMPHRGFWPNGAWNSVVASQTAAHFPRQQFTDITSSYTQIERQAGFSVEEMAAWYALYTMVGPGRRLDPSSEARIREGLSQARTINRVMVAIANIVAVRANSLGLSFSAGDLALIDQGKHRPLQPDHDPEVSLYNGGGVPFGAICAPIGKPPSVSGQGHFSAVPSLIDDAVKNLPDYAGGAR